MSHILTEGMELAHTTGSLKLGSARREEKRSDRFDDGGGDDGGDNDVEQPLIARSFLETPRASGVSYADTRRIEPEEWSSELLRGVQESNLQQILDAARVPGADLSTRVALKSFDDATFSFDRAQIWGRDSRLFHSLGALVFMDFYSLALCV